MPRIDPEVLARRAVDSMQLADPVVASPRFGGDVREDGEILTHGEQWEFGPPGVASTP
ncbi:hypothetical protein ACFWV1_11045 [Streptomyces sp. NPDC058700]|uniref:hypothetical protein n=1 Tax=unclassified Streptomyces TaxID=2593676 RepID=UPI0036466F78